MGKLLTFAIVLCLSAVSIPVRADGVPTRPGQGAWEANLTHYRFGEDGEPSVAVNPLDRNNVIVTYMETGGMFSALIHGQRIPRYGDEIAQPIQSCRYVVTHDGGVTWRMKFVPATDAVFPHCSDTYVLFGPDGKAYIMAGAWNPAFPLWDEVRILTSVDGGETWSAPATALRNTLNPGSAPLDDISKGRVRQYIDRYWISLDDATGALYVTAVQTWIQAGQSGPVGPIVASFDGGMTWSDPTMVAPVGSPHLGAAFGKVAVTWTDANCACVVFALSTDGARTFTNKPTPFGGSGSQVVADPTHDGRFAVMVRQGDLKVYVTEDAGDTWSSGVVISGDAPEGARNKPWISYSRTGVLGAGWRNTYPDGSYDFWAAFARDGASWQPARRISTQKSPPQHPIWVGGNDTSDVQFGPDDTLYAAWDDWRTGDMDIFWGGFPTREELA
jgi:hypothetical protein